MNGRYAGTAGQYALISRFNLGGCGPTVAIKDCIDIHGMQTCGGSAALAGQPAAMAHADVVRHFLNAGWQITGKANMHELAFGMTGINEHAGTPVNPQDVTRIPGGSSSGSAAAVSACLVDVAVGSDTGGSIRGPAACCGVIGLKPTFGRVSRAGAYPARSTLDCIGPLARTMELIIDAMEVMAPGFDRTQATADAAARTVAVVSTSSEPSMTEAVEQAVALTGWRTRRATLPGMGQAFDAGLALINAETYAAFGHLTGQGKLGADIEQRLSAAGATTGEAIAAAERVRQVFTGEVDALLEDADALVLPTLPHLPPTLAEVRAGRSVIAMSSLIRPFNLSGHPALSIPIPMAGASVLASLQLVGRKGRDEDLCALGLHLQHALNLAPAGS